MGVDAACYARGVVGKPALRVVAGEAEEGVAQGVVVQQLDIVGDNVRDVEQCLLLGVKADIA